MFYSGIFDCCEARSCLRRTKGEVLLPPFLRTPRASFRAATRAGAFVAAARPGGLIRFCVGWSGTTRPGRRRIRGQPPPGRFSSQRAWAGDCARSCSGAFWCVCHADIRAERLAHLLSPTKSLPGSVVVHREGRTWGLETTPLPHPVRNCRRIQ